MSALIPSPPASPSASSNVELSNTPRRNNSSHHFKRRESYPGGSTSNHASKNAHRRQSDSMENHQSHQDEHQHPEPDLQHHPQHHQHHHGHATLKVEFSIPLTWVEARSRLQFTLERWNDERRTRSGGIRRLSSGYSCAASTLSSPSHRAEPSHTLHHQGDADVNPDDTPINDSINNNFPSIISWLEDPDMLLFAVPLSLIFSILSFVLPMLDLDHGQTASGNENIFHATQKAAGILFLLSSLASAWISWRRRKITRETDASIERRRCVAEFLAGMRSRWKSSRDDCSSMGVGVGTSFHFKRTNSGIMNLNAIPRKNVEDVYSTYRLGQNQPNNDVPFNDKKRRSSNNPHDTDQGQWHQIPSLLLVQGDFIALKVGDTAPAQCRPVVVSTSASTLDGSTIDAGPVDNTQFNIVHAGERLTIDSLSSMAKQALSLSNTDSGNASCGVPGHASNGGLLPPGRSTLRYHSEDLLTLANGAQIFILLETPLDSFLRRKDIAKHKTPQLIRQGQAIREIFLYVAIIAFFVTLLLLLVRPNGAQYFFQSTAWTLPLLSALSVLPVTTPLCIFLLECVGTARILATVHPLASNQKQNVTSKPANDGRSSKGIAMINLRNNALSSCDHWIPEKNGVEKPTLWLLLRYLVATASSRLFTKSPLKKIKVWKGGASTSLSVISSPSPRYERSRESQDALLSIPPASLYLLEKLGVVTALTFIDDELACDPHSTPQQLLIPSGQGGLKLLDLCPVFEDEDGYSTDEDNEHGNFPSSSRSFGGSKHQSLQHSDVFSLDSDDDPNDETRYNHTFSAPARTLKKIRGRYRKKRRTRGGHIGELSNGAIQQSSGGYDDDGDVEVQFEDPQWWQFLPSLKCIGLGCLLVEDGIVSSDGMNASASNSHQSQTFQSTKVTFGSRKLGHNPRTLSPAETSLVDHLCEERSRKQLRLLARCIGFDTSPNERGSRGDLSTFQERRRLHIISTNLLRTRMKVDSHALGLEDSRYSSQLYTDATSVIVQDSRSGADQVLTVGDAGVVTGLCPDSWQGENSTISPLTANDRQIINDTSKQWLLADLDVVAFSYAPLPYTADHKIGWGSGKDSHIYLLDNVSGLTSTTGFSGTSTSGTGYWSLVKNQIFLGLLGSSVRPRKEIEPLIDSCAAAGVRWVYFSPRNMRRTKELASQMGIDVAWNCAISLRPLEEGKDDTYRMTSEYADWDVNAKLPHGVEDVKRHLEEVDNVPLLVSLYTDSTKKTNAEMVNVFQDYHDTVLSVGLSHLPGNQEIFSRADLAIGVDVLAEEVSFDDSKTVKTNEYSSLLPDEVAFVSSISTYSSVFNLWGSRATSHLLEIIRTGRASLEAATSAVSFVLSGCLSFSMFIIFCACTASTAVPTIPALGSFLYIQLIVLILGISMVTTDEDKESMTRVPPKNDTSIKFSLKASRRLYMNGLLRAAPPAIMPQFVYLIALGELVWEFDQEFVEEHCLPSSTAINMDSKKTPIASIIRCEALRNYSGPATVSAGTICLASLAVCTCIASTSYVFRTESIRSEPPWRRSPLWVASLFLSFILIAVYLAIFLEEGSMSSLPAYFYVLFMSSPFICLFLSEMVKKIDQKHEKRAATMRRLQFETRLGMWSPKESTHFAESNFAMESHSPIV